MVKRFQNKTGRSLIISDVDGNEFTIIPGEFVLGSFYAKYSALTYIDNNGEGIDLSQGKNNKVIGGGGNPAFSTDDRLDQEPTDLRYQLGATDPAGTQRNSCIGSSTDYDAFDIEPAPAITGTTASAVFTRTEGAWVANQLVNQYAFSYVDGAKHTGKWERIIANDTTTVTTATDLFASADRLITCPWNPIAGEVSTGGAAYNYTNISSDGSDYWLSPFTSADVLRLNPVTGVGQGYTHGQAITDGVSIGGVYDGESMWFSAYSGDFMKVSLNGDGTLTRYPHTKGDQAFIGMVFTGRYIFSAPHDADSIVRIDPQTSEIKYYPHNAVNTDTEQAGFHFYGLIQVDDYIWLAPYSSSTIVRLHIPTGKIDHFAHGEPTLAFTGVVKVGDELIFIPAKSPNILKFNVKTNKMTRIAHNRDISTYTAFNGAAFDGRRYIYMNDQFGSTLVRFDTKTNKIAEFPLGKGLGSFFGCVHINNQIIMAPYAYTNVVRVALPQAGASGMTVHGTLNVDRIKPKFNTLYASNAAALAGGVEIGELYADTTGVIKIAIEEV